jgi:hypothetical protein
LFDLGQKLIDLTLTIMDGVKSVIVQAQRLSDRTLSSNFGGQRLIVQALKSKFQA